MRRAAPGSESIDDNCITFHAGCFRSVRFGAAVWPRANIVASTSSSGSARSPKPMEVSWTLRGMRAA